MTSIERNIMKNKEKIEKDSKRTVKEKLKILKGKRTKLINKVPNTPEEFEEIQEKLNIIELEINELKIKGE